MRRWGGSGRTRPPPTRRGSPERSRPGRAWLGQFWAVERADHADSGAARRFRATAGDTTFSVHGGSVNGVAVGPPERRVLRHDDQRHRLHPVPTRFGHSHDFRPAATRSSTRERVAVDLWNYALGATTQSFNWMPGAGIVQQFNTNYTSFANYLNLSCESGKAVCCTPMTAHPPTLDLACRNGLGRDSLAAALNGPAGRRTMAPTAARWSPPCPITRRSCRGSRGTTRRSRQRQQYHGISGLAESQSSPTTATMDCDVTLRNAELPCAWGPRKRRRPQSRS